MDKLILSVWWHVIIILGSDDETIVVPEGAEGESIFVLEGAENEPVVVVPEQGVDNKKFGRWMAQKAKKPKKCSERLNAFQSLAECFLVFYIDKMHKEKTNDKA